MLRSPLSNLIAGLISAVVFAVTFALAGAGSVAVMAALAPPSAPEQRFAAQLAAWIIALQVGAIAAACGGVAGVLYALAPSRMRDTWTAMALGVGVVLAPLVVTGWGSAYPLTWLLSLAAFAAIASALAALVVRKLSTISSSKN